MEKTDFSNFEIIEKLVTDHFSLSSDSLKVFKKRLYEPFIDDIYKDILKDSQDLRSHYKIPDNFLEAFDKGWELFKKYFPYFIREIDIKYSDFRNNKIVIGKNILKIKKALMEFYIENKAYSASLLGIYHFEPKDLALLEALEQKIIDILNKVGTFKLPSNGIELVLSLNFADWFLCSTGEKWNSCINLESGFNGCYWSGIPGLVGDKNRAMLYVTDGTKKTYLGIVNQSIISRSWVLLDNQNKLNLVKFFPSEMIERGKIAKITNLPIKQDNQYTTKYPIEFLFFNNKKSSFIYLDFSRFTKKSDGFYIECYGGGCYQFLDLEKNKLQEGGIFIYKSGLTNLVSKKLSLADIVSRTCSHCGYSEDFATFRNFENLVLCTNCYQEMTTTCRDCGSIILRNSSLNAEGRILCKHCFELNYAICEDCGKVSRKENIILFRIKNIDKEAPGAPAVTEQNSKRICKECLKNIEEEYKICDTCHEGEFEPDEKEFINLYNGEIICKKCLKLEINKGQLLFNLTPIIYNYNMIYNMEHDEINATITYTAV